MWKPSELELEFWWLVIVEECNKKNINMGARFLLK